MNILLAGSVKESVDEKYKKEAEKLVQYISKKRYNVICCADKECKSILGRIYKRLILEGKVKVFFTIPKIYENEMKDFSYKIDKIFNSSEERTNFCLKQADISIFLPGGIGTLYELLCAIETNRSGEFKSKILIINSYGYFDKLLEMLEEVYKENFANPKDKNTYIVINNIEEVEKYL